MRAIELDVLARVENVEAAHPEADGQAEQPRLGAASAPPAASQPPTGATAIARPRNSLRVRRVALRQRIPEHDRERDRRQQRGRRGSAASAATTNTIDDTDDEDASPRARVMRAARDLAHRRARIQRVHAGIDQAIESHRGTARRHHRDDDPADLPPRERRLRAQASSAPVSANGSANTEWLKRMNDR